MLHLSSCQVLTVKDKVLFNASNMFSFLWCLIEGGIFSSKFLMAVSFSSSVTHHVHKQGVKSVALILKLIFQ